MARRRPKRQLGVVTPADEGLGMTTIMDRSLASRWGVPYVRLAVLAIDLDRIAAETAEDPDWPTGWEVLLTEAYLIAHFDPEKDADRELLEDACTTAMEAGQAFGAQLPFALYDAVHREVWPRTFRPLFAAWKHPPRALLKDLARLHEGGPERVQALTEASLAHPLDPPLADPTKEALASLLGRESQA